MNGSRPERSALVIDDSPRWRALLGEALRTSGWNVLAFAVPPEDLPPAAYQLLVLEAPAGAGQDQTSAQLSRLAVRGVRCILLTRQPPAELSPTLARHPAVLGVLHKSGFQEAALAALLPPPAPAQPAASGPRVLVVEDDVHWRAIYDEALLEMGYAPDCAVSYGEARGWLQRVDYVLAIVDLNLASSAAPEGNRDGLFLLRATRQRGVPSIVVSALGDPADIDRAYDEFGIFTFIEKEGFDRHSFMRLVSEAVASASTDAAGANDAEAGAQGLDQLTPREREVLALLTQGFTNRQIAQSLLITPNTTKKHVDHILQKLGVNTRAGAVAVALRNP